MLVIRGSGAKYSVYGEYTHEGFWDLNILTRLEYDLSLIYHE